MRAALIGLTVLVSACGTSSKPGADGEAEAPAVQPVEKPAPEVEVPEEPPAPEVGPLPAGKPMPGFPKVAMVGYGMRLEVNPPFQAARMSGLYGSEDGDVLVVSWWDTSHPDAGKHGRVALYNVGMVPGDPQPEGTAFRPVEETVRDKQVRKVQLGQTGSTLQFPDNHNALGGMGTLTQGPDSKGWAVQVGDAEPVPFPEEQGVMLHSWDPANGGPIHFDKRPQQPWGPWPQLEKKEAPPTKK